MSENIKDLNEYIICSAIWYNDDIWHEGHHPRNIKTGMVISGWRHHNCFTILNIMFPDNRYKYGRSKQGFLTNKGVFVDRKLGGEIAFAAGQTKELIKNLTSEDIY